jgi:hypothetical protein
MMADLQPHQQRVVTEREELADKLSKLSAFIVGSVFASLPDAEQERLRRQAQIMDAYVNVLDERIAAFG